MCDASFAYLNIKTVDLQWRTVEFDGDGLEGHFLSAAYTEHFVWTVAALGARTKWNMFNF